MIFHSPGALKDMLKRKQDTMMVGALMLNVTCLMQEIQESRMLNEQLHRKIPCKKTSSLDKKQLQ